MYSLVETAKESGVDPYKYFVYALTEAAKLSAAGNTDQIGKLTPNYFKNLNF
ncbi:MAG: transposase domain-containing protein [Clostridiaceae bacterium]|nr:transposase domain-containing protein [Clostridiaceae bacterium]